jgi:hypothetical protein
MRRGRTSASVAPLPALLALAALAAAFGCDADPIHTAEVQALGPEATGIPVGEYHRAGQDCSVCHGGEGPASTQFSIAGTVFFGPASAAPPVGVGNVTVYLQDNSTAMARAFTTNCVGNFFATTGDYNPQFPILVTIGGTPQAQYLQVSMQSQIGRDASCGGCHQYPASYDSPGLIHLNAADDPTYMGDPSCPVPTTPPNVRAP